MENGTFTILLIDDDIAIRELLSDVLNEAGYQVVSFDNFKDAVEYINSQNVDVIIVDLYFSGKFQDDIFSELTPIALRSPIIVYTAFSSLQTAKQALQARFFSYVEKESSPEELLKEIQRAIHYKFKLEKEYLENILKRRTRELEEEVQRRREKERNLQLSEEKYRLIVEAIPALVFLTDDKGNFLYLSPYVSKILKVNPEKINIDTLLSLLTPESYQKISKYIDGFRLFLSQRVLFQINEDITLLTPEGEKIFANLIVKPLFLEETCIGFHGVLRDITSEVQSRLELQETLEELTTLYQSISDYIFILDKQYRIYRLNDPARKFLEKNGQDANNIMFKKWGEAIKCKNHFLADGGCGNHEECMQCPVRNFLKKVSKEGIREQIDFAFPTSSGLNVFYFMAYGREILMQEGEFIFLSLTDITQLRQTYEELLKMNQQFQTLVDNIHEGLLLLDANKHEVLFFNEMLLKLLEVLSEEIHRDPFCWLTKVVGKQVIERELQTFLYQNESKIVTTFEYLAYDRLNSISMSGIKIPVERPSMIMFIFSDISLLKKGTLKDLRIWAEVELEERKKLARKIHDEINPIAGLLTSSCSFLEQVIHENHKELLEKHKKNIQILQKSLYDISHQLEERWEDFSFQESIQQYVDELMNNEEIQIYLNIKAVVDSLLYKKNLYAITLELIHNTLKYANAKNIILELLPFENFVLYRYQDDGQGFDFEKVKLNNKGLGLKHIKERVREMGGTLEFITSPDHGVEVKIYLFMDT